MGGLGTSDIEGEFWNALLFDYFVDLFHLSIIIMGGVVS